MCFIFYAFLLQTPPCFTSHVPSVFVFFHDGVCRLLKFHNVLCSLIDDPRDTKRGSNLEQVWHETLVEATGTFILQRLLGDIPDTRVASWVHASALGLKSSSEDVEGIHDRSTKSSRRCTHDASHHAGWLRHVFLVDTELFSLICDPRRFEEFESSHVQSRVGEHADEAHGNSAVPGSEATFGPHLRDSLLEQGVAASSAGHILGLKTTPKSAGFLKE
jgi:hypothetical protein